MPASFRFCYDIIETHAIISSNEEINFLVDQRLALGTNDPFEVRTSFCSILLDHLHSNRRACLVSFWKFKGT